MTTISDNPIVRWCQRHPLASPLLAGLMARIIASIAGLGFQARDDYFHILDPALRWIANPGFDWDNSGAAGSGIRSHLVPRLIQYAVETLQGLGVVDPESILSGLHLIVGAYSLLTIVAVYLLAHELLSRRGDTTGAHLAVWLTALHFGMPYVGTRLLIEAMAMPPLVFGMWLCTSARFRNILFGGFCIGLACWLRYQVGTAAIGIAIAIGLRGFKEHGVAGLVQQTGALAIGGAAAIGLEGMFDYWTTGTFLGPLIANIQVNLNPPSDLTRSALFTYVGTWLVLTAPPATLIIAPAIVIAASRLALVTWPFIIFVGVHSLIAHKEERFMLPVLPLFLILLGAAPAAIRESRGKLGALLRRGWPLSLKWFGAVHVALLLIVITGQSQQNLRQAMDKLRKDPEIVHAISLGPEFQTFFLGRDDINLYRKRKFDALWIRKTLDRIGDGRSVDKIHFLSFEPDRTSIALILTAEGLACSIPETLQGWWADRLIYRANPRRNRRRAAIDIWQCLYPQVAQIPDDGSVIPEQRRTGELSTTEAPRDLVAHRL